MKTVDLRDLAGGLLVAAAGGAFALAASSFPDGQAGEVGPAYVPTAVGIIAIVLGLVIAGGSVRRATEFPSMELRPVLAVFAAVAVFGLLIRLVGLVPAVFAVVVVASFGSRKNRPAAGVAAGCWAMFVVLLGLPMEAFRSPF